MSLDFREITEEGLVFDELKGSFRIDFGNAFTCDLGLEGEIADMGIVGRVGITAEDYDQIAAVRPHVSNLAPAKRPVPPMTVHVSVPRKTFPPTASRTCVQCIVSVSPFAAVNVSTKVVVLGGVNEPFAE